MDIMNSTELNEEVLEEIVGGKAVKATYYVIQKGDTLLKIANRYKTTTKHLMDMNPAITDPNKIYAGQKIRVK